MNARQVLRNTQPLGLHRRKGTSLERNNQRRVHEEALRALDQLIAAVRGGQVLTDARGTTVTFSPRATRALLTAVEPFL